MQQLLAWAGTILGLVGILGASIAYIRSTVARTTLELYKGEAQVLALKAERLEKEHVACVAKLKAVREELAKLRDDYDELKTIVTSALKRVPVTPARKR